MTDLKRTRALDGIQRKRVFWARARFEAPRHVVEMFGELDVASRAEAKRVCSRPAHLHVLVDVSGLAFLDCAGYSALVAARSVLERRDGSLTIVNPVGAPRRLLELIESLERGPRELTQDGPAPVPLPSRFRHG